MKPEMLEIKLRQFMSPGKPYYLKEILIGIGLDLHIKLVTLERKLRNVDAVYFRRKGKYKHYYIEPLPVDPCKYSKLHDRFVAFMNKPYFINIGRK